MIDGRFSAEAFKRCGLDTEDARKLTDILANEIQHELHHVVETKMKKIVHQLNQMGHNLVLYDKQSAHAIAYRDCPDDDCKHKYRLRVAVDTTISTGYAHLISPEYLDY